MERQNFLGVINFNRKLRPGAVEMLRPLTDALRGFLRPKATVEWMPELGAAFKAPKVALGKATNLAYPKQGAKLALMVDASANRWASSP